MTRVRPYTETSILAPCSLLCVRVAAEEKLSRQMHLEERNKQIANRERKIILEKKEREEDFVNKEYAKWTQRKKV